MTSLNSKKPNIWPLRRYEPTSCSTAAAYCGPCHAFISGYIDGLAQDCTDSSALAMESLQSCTKPSYNTLCDGYIMTCTFFPNWWRYCVIRLSVKLLVNKRWQKYYWYFHPDISAITQLYYLYNWKPIPENLSHRTQAYPHFHFLIVTSIFFIMCTICARCDVMGGHVM